MPDADETTQTPPQGDPAASSTPPVNPPSQSLPSTPAGDPQEPGDADGLKRALAAERANSANASREAKAKAKELTDAQAKLKEYEQAQLTETERLQTQLKEITEKAAKTERDARSKSVRFAVSTAARDADFINPDDAYHFIDLDTIEFDAAGDPQGVGDAVKALAKDRPYLTKGEPRNGPPPTDKSGRATGTPTPEEVRAHNFAFRTHTHERF